MPRRLGRVATPAVGTACILALALSFVVARGGGEPQADDPLAPAIPTTKPAAAITTPLLGRAHDLPPLAPAPPKPAKRRSPAPESPVPAPATPAPSPEPAPYVEPEPAYTPPPVSVAPAQPAPEPGPAPPQPDPPPPVYFDDSG